VNEVEPIADDDERQLLGELSLLQEVFDLLRIVVIWFRVSECNG
jgi:hypothetical protein